MVFPGLTSQPPAAAPAETHDKELSTMLHALHLPARAAFPHPPSLAQPRTSGPDHGVRKTTCLLERPGGEPSGARPGLP